MTEPAPQRSLFSSGDLELDARLRELVDKLDPVDAQLVFDMLATAMRLANDPISRLDRKIVSSALKEMRYAFSVFAPYRDIRKVTVFGSSRTSSKDPTYAVARSLGEKMAALDWMVVTGAGPGIMQAANEGAGEAKSFGVNIMLPFEAKANPVIAGDPKLMNFKYFFTRKLMFIKEADAFVLLPGGFGTLDETFELLTLIQTGKSDLHPIILLDCPGGDYWRHFREYLRTNLLTAGYIFESDLDLFTYTDNVDEAIAEILRFYRVYHSQRYVRDRLVLRLLKEPTDIEVDELSAEFKDVLGGPIRKVQTSPPEIRDNDVVDLPRIALDFDRMHAGRLRRLVDRLNDL